MESPARYDGIADWYDEYIQSSPQTQTALATVPALLGRGPGTCLDIGCGTGAAFDTLASLDWTVVGVDLSVDQLEIARPRAERLGGRVEHADASILPFGDESFDSAISLLTHTDFDDAAAVFREAARVIRIGGRLAYVGVHPCFVGPMSDLTDRTVPTLRTAYRQAGWWTDAPGPVRSRVSANHIPLADFLNAIVGAGWKIDHVVETGDDDYPMLLGVAATRDPDVGWPRPAS